MTVSFTIDGTDLTGAPLAHSTDQATADQIATKANEFRDVVMHLHADVAGSEVTLTAANCPPGEIAFGFGDGSYDVTERIADGDTPTATHTYQTDGVYTATLRHSNGERATLEVAINWPPA